MRKSLSILLVFVMVLAMCACAPQEQQSSTDGTADTTAGQEGANLVGFGEVNTTPEWSVPLSGFGNVYDRMSTGMYTYIYVYALAVTDANDNTAVLVAMDLAATAKSFADEIRLWCNETYGIPVENVAIASLHQHSTPTGDENYTKALTQWIKDAITEAMNDRAPAQMYMNTVKTEALSFVRNYWTNDGTLWGPNFGDDSSGLKSHESESDKDMQLLKFKREGRKDIIVANFQAHPHMGTSSTDTNVSADWPGIMREQVKAELDCNIMYFTGASGNLNSGSSIASENISLDWKDHGRRAAEYVINAEDSYTAVEMGAVTAKEVTYSYKVDHSMDHMIEEAKKVHALRQELGVYGVWPYIDQYPGINSPYHASAIVSKFDMGETKDIQISAISIGDVAFTIHPYEMYDTNGMELKAGTVGNKNYVPEDQMENPYEMTFIVTCANGSNGYIPSALGYTNGGYAVDTTDFAAGAGEDLVADYLNILAELGK